MNVDIFVILDNAQYTKALTHKNGTTQVREKSYQSDTPIRFAQGNMFLTVPVLHSGYSPINKTRIDYNQKWSSRHLTYLKSGYQKSQNFPLLYPKIKKILSEKFSTLAKLNITTTLWSLAYLLGHELPISQCTIENINMLLTTQSIRLKKILVGRDITSLRPEGLHKGTEWTVAICKELGASEYVHGKTAMVNYMDQDYYKKNGIQTILQDWHCRWYPQQFEKTLPFSPNLSVLDILFNTSIEDARELLK